MNEFLLYLFENEKIIATKALFFYKIFKSTLIYINHVSIKLCPNSLVTSCVLRHCYCAIKVDYDNAIRTLVTTESGLTCLLYF